LQFPVEDEGRLEVKRVIKHDESLPNNTKKAKFKILNGEKTENFRCEICNAKKAKMAKKKKDQAKNMQK